MYPMTFLVVRTQSSALWQAVLPSTCSAPTPATKCSNSSHSAIMSRHESSTLSAHSMITGLRVLRGVDRFCSFIDSVSPSSKYKITIPETQTGEEAMATPLARERQQGGWSQGPTKSRTSSDKAHIRTRTRGDGSTNGTATRTPIM